MTQEELTKYLINEIKQITLQEGITASDSDVAEILTNLHRELECIKILSKNDLNESFSPVKPEETPTTEEVLENVKEVKQLNEEFKRWKQLIDFRSPLLNKENQ